MSRVYRSGIVAAIGCLFLSVASLFAAADIAPASQPSTSVKTGEFDATFTERSPLSDRKELARRLSLKEADMGADYDLSKCPFKVSVPANYDPSTPVGVFVYLGYKDSVSTPPLWDPVLEKNHLIFITPVCHSGENFLPAVPKWQTLGLALDAVYNLKRQYAIDDKRIYQMSWNEGTTQIAFADSDVFTGFILVYDQGWYAPMRAANGGSYRATFLPPPILQVRRAKSRPFVLVDDKSVELAKEVALKAGAMKSDGFDHVMQIGLSNLDDLHYPNFSVAWFSDQILPFLDKSAAEQPKMPAAAASGSAGTATTGPSEAAAPSEAESLLSQARLLMKNNLNDLARHKLQQIIDNFPSDPAAATAKELLAQIGGQ